jgi:hypothetical protein
VSLCCHRLWAGAGVGEERNPEIRSPAVAARKGEALLQLDGMYFSEQSLCIVSRIIVDAEIISTPGSTKNREEVDIFLTCARRERVISCVLAWQRRLVWSVKTAISRGRVTSANVRDFHVLDDMRHGD